MARETSHFIWSEDEARDIARRFDPRRPAPSFYDNPYPTYRALLKYDPVHLCPDGSYLLSRYDDLLGIYRDTRLFSSDKREEFFPKFGASPLYEHHTSSLVFNDPPLHTRVRNLIVGALNPRVIAHTEERLISLVDGLLDHMESKNKVDLIEDFAAAIPIEIIGNLLDIPRVERGPLRAWSLAILGALEPSLTPAQKETGNRAVTDFLGYLKGLVTDRRKNPGDPSRDVLTRLIMAEGYGETLSETELMQNCIFILNAGHETTTNLIGNGLFALLEWPDERQKLIDNPALISTAVEEFLRFESSNQLGNRRATQGVEIGGVRMAPGAQLTLCIGAANRDPSRFPEPDRMDITRRLNKHLAFGGGPHTCAGLSLARLEGKIAISHLLARFPHYALNGAPVRSGRIRFRGFSSLPILLK